MDKLETIPPHALSPRAFSALLGRPDTPLVLDVRSPERFSESPHRLPLSEHIAPEALGSWLRHTKPQSVVLCCVHGHGVSQNAARQLRALGWDARFLLGGIEGGEPGVDSPELLQALKEQPVLRLLKRLDLIPHTPSRWITREHPKIDRIACPWLIRRFIDRDAMFVFAPTARVLARAQQLPALAFDIPGAPITHDGERCSLDMLLGAFGLCSQALDLLARIVRGADTDRLDLAAPAAGLLAVSLGMSRLYAADDHAMLEAMMPVYDALYAWCVDQVQGQPETHRWSPP